MLLCGHTGFTAWGGVGACVRAWGQVWVCTCDQSKGDVHTRVCVKSQCVSTYTERQAVRPVRGQVPAGLVVISLLQPRSLGTGVARGTQKYPLQSGCGLMGWPLAEISFTFRA